MQLDEIVLHGKYVRLEPLQTEHAQALASVSAVDPSLYRWSAVPRDLATAKSYIEKALAWRAAGTAVPFATVRLSDGQVIGSTRFFDIERWTWPSGHERSTQGGYDGAEIGYTWLTRSAIRTAANTEAKLLMLTHAFETWRMLRICLHTDIRNERSRAAIERIGGKFEGILRSHRIAADAIARDSARYSILASEWNEVKQRLQQARG